jgi:2Fe-2S ferredoxin
MLTINPSGTTVPSTEGMSILEAVLAAGVKMPHKCEGKAECGSCHIFVTEGR